MNKIRKYLIYLLGGVTEEYCDRKIDGTKVRAAISFKKLKFLEVRKNFLITKEGISAIPPMPKDMGILAQES